MRYKMSSALVCCSILIAMLNPLFAQGVAQPVEVAKLLPSDGAGGNYFGLAVAIEGDIAVVGATGNDGSGSAYLFKFNGSAWIQLAKLSASDGLSGDGFGTNVAIDGDAVVVGASTADAPAVDSGSAYVFSKPPSGWADMTQTAKLTVSDGASGDHFGGDVGIWGDVVVVGAGRDDDNGNDSGSAYIFVKPPSGWMDNTETAQLTASDGAAGDLLASANISGDTVVVGAHRDDSLRGAAYVFDKPAGGWVDMTETAKLTASDRDPSDLFGHFTAISGDTVLIGATEQSGGMGVGNGSAYVFEKPPGGWANMTETAKLTASDGLLGDVFGHGVAIGGNTIVVGAPNNEGEGANEGAAYLFKKPPNGWVDMNETAKLTASDGATDDGFGAAVATTEEFALIGARAADPQGADSGAAYVFALNEPILWSKLGSDIEVQNSEIGPDGVIIGDVSYYPGMFDDGFKPDPRTGDHNLTSNCIRYEGLELGQQGTIEFWFQPDWISGGHIRHIFNYGPRTPDNPYYIALHFNDWQNKFNLNLRDHSSLVSVARYLVPSSTPEWSTTEPFHVAIVWDGTAAGNADKLKLYLNGIERGTLTGEGSPTFADWSDGNYFYVATRWQEGDWDRHHWEGTDGVMDNLKVWDFPKSNFDDRFDEGPEICRDLDSDGYGSPGSLVCPEGDLEDCDDANASVYPGAMEVCNGIDDDCDGGVPADEMDNDSDGYRICDGDCEDADAEINPGASEICNGLDDDCDGGVPADEADGDSDGYRICSFDCDDSDAGVTPEVAKLMPADNGEGDRFGWVAVDGDVAVIGADLDDNSGSAYAFRFDGSDWVEEAKLLASDGAAGDKFGQSLAIVGDVAVIGAWASDVHGTDSGSAYVYRYSGSAWIQEAQLAPSSIGPGDVFGYGVSMDGDRVLIGAQYDDDNGTEAGAAYIFRHDGFGWVEEAKLLASDGSAGDLFGEGALHGDVAVIGSISSEGYREGSVYVFRFNGSAWVEEQKLLPSDSSAGNHFGFSPTVSGDTIVAGASEYGSGAGSAYVFRYDGASWIEEAKLLASDGTQYDAFGTYVAILDDTVVIGGGQSYGNHGPGVAYVFRYSGTNWVEQAKLVASDGTVGDRLGVRVAISGDKVLVSAYGNDENGTDSGSAYVFDLDCDPMALCRDVVVEADGSCLGAVAPEDLDDGSYDPEGDPITLSLDLSGPFPLGDTVVALSVSDEYDSSECTATVTVIDVTSPEISCPASVVLECPAVTTPAATGSAMASDNCSVTPVDFIDEVLPGCGLTEMITRTWTATDGSANTAACVQLIEVADTTPPDISVTLDPDTLWPPNHRMIGVEATVTTHDACSPVEVALTLVTSSEADNAPGGGDGNTDNDIQGADLGTEDYLFQLRAERAGSGVARIYTATYAASDCSGNSASDAGYSHVPHDQGGGSDPIVLTVDHGEAGTVVLWGEIEEAQFYDVIRGHLGEIGDAGPVYGLGTVTCVEAGSVDGTTLGSEDTDLPAPGEAFFYLVQYDDGASSSYGTETAGKPRVPGPGDCE